MRKVNVQILWPLMHAESRGKADGGGFTVHAKTEQICDCTGTRVNIQHKLLNLSLCISNTYAKYIYILKKILGMHKKHQKKRGDTTSCVMHAQALACLNGSSHNFIFFNDFFPEVYFRC